MACGGCGKGRQGTSAVKARRRASAGNIAAEMVKNAGAPVAPKVSDPHYNERFSEYLRAQQEYRKSRGW